MPDPNPFELELFTPVGERRAQALAVLRQFSEVLDSGDNDLARAILATVEPEPTQDLPAISHVIGVGLGLLDTWYTDSALRESLRTPRIPAWQTHSRSAAKTILGLACDGQAFDSLDELHSQFGGLQIFEGTALAVYAALSSVAEFRDTDVEHIAGEFFGADASAVPASSAQGSPSHVRKIESAPSRTNSTGKQTPKEDGRRRTSSNSSKRGHVGAYHVLLADFGAWLRDQPAIAAPNVEDETAMFDSLLTLAQRAGTDPRTPFGLEKLTDEIFMLDEDEYPGITEAALGTLHDYVHFRMDTSGESSAWQEAHETLETALSEFHPGLDALSEALKAADEIDPDSRRAAYAQTRIVAMVPHLLEWIGAGRKTSASGAVRRVDIAEAAAMLGISAVGVNKYPDYQPGDSSTDHDTETPIYATSMIGVPLLPAWWEALLTAQVIETTATSVRRGPAADQWLAEQLPPLELAEMVVGIFLAEFLTQDLGHYGAYEDRAIALTMARLLQAVTGDDILLVEESEIDGSLEQWVLQKLRLLEQVGLVELGEDGGIVVPPRLRGAIARGLIATASYMEMLEAE